MCKADSAIYKTRADWFDRSKLHSVALYFATDHARYRTEKPASFTRQPFSTIETSKRAPKCARFLRYVKRGAPSPVFEVPIRTADVLLRSTAHLLPRLTLGTIHNDE
jgi:hypothetical protein